MKKIWFRTCNFILLLAVFCTSVSAQESTAGKKGNFNNGGQVDVSASKLIDIVVAADPVLFKSRNEEQIANFLRDKNNKIIDYLVAKYPQHGVPDVDVNDPATVWFGLVCAMYEANNFKPLSGMQKGSSIQGKIPSWLECSIGVLSASIGIKEIIAELGVFSYGSAWTVVKFVVKKYITGWLGTAIALVQIADECF